MFTTAWASASAGASSASLAPQDVYDLADEYGTDAAVKLSQVLHALETAGFPKARVNAYSAFDRVLSGAAWLLQRLVKREDASDGRVQWDVLFQSHTKMKPRLGLAQEVVRCVEALPFDCPVTIQPHQLLLQDFGDIETVLKLITWLIGEARDAAHLEKIREKREYLAVGQERQQRETKREVKLLLDVYAPRRRWQYVAADGEDDEDALTQRCLLEYGERVAVAEEELESAVEEDGETNPTDFMAQIAGQAAAIAKGGKIQKKGFKLHQKRRNDPKAAEFDRQYQKAVKQATEEQQHLMSKRREREAQLLEKVVTAPEIQEGSAIRQMSMSSEMVETPIQVARMQLKEHESKVQQLIQEKKALDIRTNESKVQAAALDEALSAVKQEISDVDAQTPQDDNTQTSLATLRQLVLKNDALKHEKNEFRTKCRLELEVLKDSIEKMKLQVTEDASNRDEEAVRLHEIEQMHAQMAQKHKDMKITAAKQTRALHLKMKQIDEIPTRIELVQYEKRFVELYDEVALTLDETRKYYCVYNTLKTTHEFLEKEISLINSINENFDVAMGSKAATEAFFGQLESIIQNVQGSVGKQQTARDDHQISVETLDSKYQLLLEQERMYVHAIREFQKECEKNEKLVSRLEELSR